mgnify:CR=1|jgi:hypothetical protein
MTSSSSRSVLRLWSLGLALSTALAAAGERWPDSLPIHPAVVWALVLLPPLAMVLVLAAGWALPHQGGESSDSDTELS